MQRLLALLLLCVAANPASAAQDAEKALKQFEGKVLVLRHPMEGGSQQFDSEGKVLKGGNAGPWTIYGGILIDKIALTPDAIGIDGRRMVFQFEKQQLVAKEVKRSVLRKLPFSSSVRLEIKLAHALDSPALGSEAQARATLARVFALDTAGLLESMPDYWLKCATDSLTYDPLQPREAEFVWQWRKPVAKRAEPSSDKPPGDKPPETASDTKSVEPGPLVFFVGANVSAPRPIFTPEPAYTSIARYAEFQGVTVLNVVVGTDGKVHSARLVRPLGLGLDEAAISTIQTWRFDPARREGKPVAVEMNIEVAFNLF